MSNDRAADRAAIRELVDRYAGAVDDRRFDAVADLFTEDAVLIAPDPPTALGPTVLHEGRDAVRELMAGLAFFTATFHAVHGVVIDPVEDPAPEGPDEFTGRVTCTAHHLSAGEDKHRDLTWQLVYRDRYRRTDDGWRFARRELRIVSIRTSNPRSVGPTVDPQEETA
ncbi:nuclear transport factor 2 family protein [Nocardioides alcanivorans]|uniref:nuclear transport factor 2 family protein n=1 Tax=Nocardioides alcanivorans TaxID=2897352 RepID=UPI001F1DFDE5|nr:nuclear transport factor 2 family protein [Nocardioides alcanivorans]